jgi:hypothetical protein
MEVVIPVKFQSHVDALDGKRLETALRSLDVFATGGVSRVHVVCTDAEREQVEALVAALPLTDALRGALNFVNESTVVRTDVLWPYLRQMMIKMRVAEAVVTSDFYLVMDCDCFMRLPFDLGTLVNADARTVQGSYPLVYPQVHKGQVDAACAVLGVEAPALPPFPFSVTPAILHTATMRAVIDFLVTRWGSVEGAFCAHPDLTEYTAYFIYMAVLAPPADRWTYESPCLWSQPVWGGAIDNPAAHLANVFDTTLEPTQPFSLIQSSSGFQAPLYEHMKALHAARFAT